MITCLAGACKEDDILTDGVAVKDGAILQVMSLKLYSLTSSQKRRHKNIAALLVLFCEGARCMPGTELDGCTNKRQDMDSIAKAYKVTTAPIAY